jgi:hypothetical protein
MLITGWTTRELDEAGAQDCADIWQVYEADQKTKRG